MRTVGRIVVLATLLAFARGPALACYALPQAVATTADVCCQMAGMGSGAGCPSRPVSSSRACCHPDNLGDQAYLRTSAKAASAIAIAMGPLVAPAAVASPVASPVLSPVVEAHAPPGRLVALPTVLRL